MREIRYNVYSYNELSEKSKESALANYPCSLLGEQVYFEMESQIDYIQDYFLPEEKGFHKGVKVYADNNRGWDIEIRGTVDTETVEKVIGMKLDDYGCHYIDIDYRNGYLHGNCEWLPEDEKQAKEADDKIENWLSDLCSQIADMLNAQEDYVYSDEYKTEMLECNDHWEFLEDGTWH